MSDKRSALWYLNIKDRKKASSKWPRTELEHETLRAEGVNWTSCNVGLNQTRGESRPKTSSFRDHSHTSLTFFSDDDIKQ